MTSDGKGIYEYDVFGHMIRAELGSEDNLNAENKNTFICRYDAEGLRYEVEENERLIRYIYKDRDVLSEESEDEGTKRYIRGNGRLIASDSEKARTYYHYVSDNIGSIHYVINSGVESVENDLGNTVAEKLYDLKSRIECHYEYDAFGNVIQSEEKIRNIFRFTGEQYDKLTGQYYLKARYYNPVIGRFTQMDTYLGDGLNLYAYVQNNPVRYVDPSGHCAKCSKENGVSESGINSLADMMSPEEAARYKAYFVKDAPDIVYSGTKELEGIHVHYNKLKGVEEVQPWKAYYDDYGRLVARTDYNAGNKAAGIPDVHYHLYEWGKGFADWKSPHEYASHLEGEFTWTTKR